MAKLVLIDGHAIIHRAYHAFPPTLQNSKGEQTNAVYGFTSILLATIKDLHPKYMAVVFDKKGPTFRHKKFKEYKGTRVKPDKEMLMQIPRIKQVVKALNLPIFEERGFEADDVIGTLAFQAKVQNFKPKAPSSKQFQNIKLLNRKTKTLKLSNSNTLEVIIVTGDQDALQLVNDRVKVWMPARSAGGPPRGRFVPAKMYKAEDVVKKLGVRPDQVVDYKALVGDQSDNIPGVVGIGPKTAGELLQKFGTVKEIYKSLGPGGRVDGKVTLKMQKDTKITENSRQIKESIRGKLITGYESAMMSYDLARIHTDAPVKLILKDCVLSDYNKEETVRVFEELEFKSLIKRLPDDGWEEMAREALGSRAVKSRRAVELESRGAGERENKKTGMPDSGIGMRKKIKREQEKKEGEQMGLF